MHLNLNGGKRRPPKKLLIWHQNGESGLVEPAWWKKGIIYQIYPRSFQDSNGDGIGDLNGIIQRLDYLSWLGVQAIWISPIFPSPMADFGYDISDYCGIDTIFGSLGDFDRLLLESHSRGLKVILDFVPNHTSDRHPWFQKSRSSKSTDKRDWYIWRDPKPGGGPPNNWVSQFGGSAWTLDRPTGQYYLHSFLREQPDLNWRNPAVRKAMFEAMRFWLDRGVDGFRVDVIWLLIKDDAFRDNPLNPAYRPGQPDINRTLSIYNADRPEIHELVAQMREVLDRYDDRVLIGEIYLPFERLVTYYGKDLSGAQMPFNFALIHAAWTAKAVADLIAEYEKALPAGGWPNWVLGNHDQPRIAARVGASQARIAAMLLLTLRGTPTMYYGDEIGLPRVDVPPELAQDPWEKNEPGLGVGRDPWRTPMQWDGSPNAGFSTSPPWLPLDANWHDRNVATLRDEPRSILSLYRRLIDIRKHHPALSIGQAQVISSDHDVLVFERRCEDQRLLVLLNFGLQSRPLSTLVAEETVPILSTALDRPTQVENHELRAAEGLILLVRPSIRTHSA
jgi:alpha-glucosidase